MWTEILCSATCLSSFLRSARTIGALMIHKTIAYLAIAWVAYRDLFCEERLSGAMVQGAGDD